MTKSSSDIVRRYWNPRVETMSRDELERLQEARLRSLLERVQTTNPFYRGLYARHGVDGTKIRSMQEFREKIPFITKQDLIKDQAEVAPYGRRMTAPMPDIAAVVLTSGTSGRGQEVHCYTFADLERSTAQFGYLAHWQGLDPGDRYFFTLHVGLDLGGIWYKRAAERYGLNMFNVAKYDTDTRIDYMTRFSPHAIATSCSYLSRVTARCRERGIDLRTAFPDLKLLSIGSEPHSVIWVQEMEDAWGVRLHERFGSNQSGGTHLFTCEGGVRDGDKRRMMHNLGHKAIIEVLDPATGEHVRSGEEGELVVTCLYREAFPSIRFRMGDRVRYMAHSDCDCGRPFDGIECGSVGRIDDMIKIKSTNIWPNTVDNVIFSTRDIAEYAARVFVDGHGRETVEVQIEFSATSELGPEARTALLAQFRRDLKTQTDVSMDVVEAPSLSLPRFETKARRWTDERMRGVQKN